MRVWSLHPEHLDRAGLVACWRETLLAQAVLAGRTAGYRRHPQLIRFRVHEHPVAAVGAYLVGVADEADARGYRFDRSRIDDPATGLASIPVTDGQLMYEWQHLGAKLRVRDPERAAGWERSEPRPHPLFLVVPGAIESWERTGD